VVIARVLRAAKNEDVRAHHQGDNSLNPYSCVEAVNIMKQTLEAIYENGVFRPLKSLKLAEGQQVQLIVETNSELSPEEMLKLAAQVYEGLSLEQVNEIEQIAFHSSDFFGEKIK
jgi:predicted DNA-binding antitoxin AbrB/MazE fold protein